MMDYSAMGERLSGEYKDVFERAELYGTVKNVAEDVKDDLMMNLFDVLLTAQEEGRKVSAVVGRDIERFCKDYYANYNIGERIKRIPESLYRMTRCIFILEIIDLFLLEDRNVLIFEARSNVFPYLCGLVIGWLMVTFGQITIKPLIFRKSFVKVKVYYVINILIYVAMIVLCVIFLGNNEVMMPVFPLILGTGIYTILYLICRSIWRYRTYGTIRKYKEEKSEFEFRIEGSFHISNLEFAKALLKRYDRKNRRMKQRGRASVSPDEFTEHIRGEIEKEKKMRKWMALLYLGIVIGIAIPNFNNGISEGLLLVLILILTEGIAYIIWLTISNLSIKSREKLFEEIDAMGVNIIEYVEMMSDSSKNGMKKISVIHSNNQS